MSEQVVQARAAAQTQPTWWIAAPAVALIVLTPILAELLMGGHTYDDPLAARA